MNKKIALILALVFAVLAVVALFIGFFPFESSDYDEYLVSSSPEPSPTEKPEVKPTAEIEVSSTISPSPTPQATEVPYVSPIDFDKLHEENPDIFAWIDIPETVVNYPILNREGDNEYYLRRNMHGNYDSDGVLFVEDYNNLDFNDPVTIIYGHNLQSGGMFGQLQKVYSDPESFQDNNTVNVYLPNETKVYQIFAAVPYSTKHILYYNNFSDAEVFDRFMTDIKETRGLNATIDDSVVVSADDNVLILSTCLETFSSDSRYLVLAVEIK